MIFLRNSRTLYISNYKQYEIEMQSFLRPLMLARAYPRVHTHVFSTKDVADPAILRLLESYTQLRTDYVLQENWPIHEGGIDFDEYDIRRDTIFVVAANRDNRVVAGMRLTPVSSLQGSLSYDMWRQSANFDDFSAQYHLAAQANPLMPHDYVWDVTRLVTEANILSSQDMQTKIESRIGLLKILARAAHIFPKGSNPVWVFTTTDKMARFMHRNEFRVTLFASGKISHTDEGISHFCIIRPQEVIAHLKKKKKIYYRIAEREGRKNR